MHVTNQSPLPSLPERPDMPSISAVRAEQLPDQPSWLTGSHIGIAAGATACALMAYYFYQKHETKLETTGQLVLATYDLKKDVDKQKQVYKFINHIWPTLRLTATPPSVLDRFKQIFVVPSSPELKTYLANKILAVLTDHKSQSDELKERICQNIIHNFETYMQEVTTNVQRDIETDENFRQTFGIQPGDHITGMTTCGKETHVSGKNPLFITLQLNHGKKIVYKPRSMLAEQVICHQKDSLFASWDPPLLTYQVYNKPGQNYGYCEFLVNQESENTFELPEDDQALVEYAQKFFLLDRIGQALGLSDIHAENIITVRKQLALVDAEVVLVPTRTDGYQATGGTGILSGNSAGWKFYDYIDGAKNQVWIKQEGQVLKRNSAAQVLNEKLMTMSGEPVTLLTAAEQQKIEGVKLALRGSRHRIILVGTEELVVLIKRPLETATKTFMTSLQDGLKSWGIEATQDEAWLTTIQNHFKTDLENNDVPVFQFDPVTRAVFYHGTQLGVIRADIYL